MESAGSGRVPRVILVSIAKSGTHLLQELMLALGYKMFGSGVWLTPQTIPVLDRDPRDVTLSAINFLADSSGKGFSAYNDIRVFSEILQAKETLEAQLTYALTDPSFPAQGDFHRMLWLLHHPRVCKTSFEELVGPAGGGSAQLQEQALKRVIDFLGITDAKPEDVAGKLFNRDSFSFYRGQIGGWREVFTRDHRRLANERFGDVMPYYGYE